MKRKILISLALIYFSLPALWMINEKSAPSINPEKIEAKAPGDSPYFPIEKKIIEESKINTVSNTINPEARPCEDCPHMDNLDYSLYLVARVIDGDTIELEDGQIVRYTGIETPESVHPRKPVECFGKEAMLKNKELVEGRMVRLEKDITDRDKYGRLLRYVYVVDPKQFVSSNLPRARSRQVEGGRGMDDIFINLELVKQGYASVYTYPPDVKFNEVFLEAQRDAKETQRGLWSACQKAA